MEKPVSRRIPHVAHLHPDLAPHIRDVGLGLDDLILNPMAYGPLVDQIRKLNRMTGFGGRKLIKVPLSSEADAKLKQLLAMHGHDRPIPRVHELLGAALLAARSNTLCSTYAARRPLVIDPPPAEGAAA